MVEKGLHVAALAVDHVRHVAFVRYNLVCIRVGQGSSVFLVQPKALII